MAETSEISVNQCAVLIVDDIDVNRLVLDQLLRNTDAVTYLAESAEEAFKILDTSHIDVILMDLRMPKISGIEATKIIRAKSDPVLAATPIIAVSADVTPEQNEACRHAGVNDFLAKPVLHQDLVDLLRRYKPALLDDVSTVPVELKRGGAVLEASRTETANNDAVAPIGPSAAGSSNALSQNGTGQMGTDISEPFDDSGITLGEAEHVSLLDLDVLDSLRSVIPPERLVALLSSFRSASNDLLKELVEAVEAGSVARIRDHAHALKGTSSSVGLKRLAHLCFEVQNACDQQDERAVYDSVAAIALAYNESLNSLDNVVQLLESGSTSAPH